MRSYEDRSMIEATLLAVLIIQLLKSGGGGGGQHIRI